MQVSKQMKEVDGKEKSMQVSKQMKEVDGDEKSICCVSLVSTRKEAR